MVKEVLTAIVTKFVELQRENPMLIIESMFRYPSREVKESILHSYGGQVTRENVNFDAGFQHQNYDQEQPDVQSEEEQDEPEQKAAVEESGEDKKKWTREQDEILITNYEQYKEIPSKTMRFEALARLVSGKTARQCYERASLLKLKKDDMDQAKKISD